MKIQSFQSCRDISGMAPDHDYITALSTWLILADGVYFDAVALRKRKIIFHKCFRRLRNPLIDCLLIVRAIRISVGFSALRFRPESGPWMPR